MERRRVREAWRLIWKKRPWSRRMFRLWSGRWAERTAELLRVVTPLDPRGAVKVRIGGRGDGGYVMIDPGRGPGLALSLGISDRSPWDLEMAERGFRVHQYDGTIEKEPDSHPNIFFNRFNVTGSHPPPEGFRSIRQILAGSAGEPGANDAVLEMDIENHEWEVFEAMERDDFLRFKQILVELHELIPNAPDFERKLKLLRKINETHQSVHVHYNNYSHLIWHRGAFVVGAAMEVTYLRRDADVVFDESDEYYPTDLDDPNTTKRPDIPIGSFSRFRIADRSR